MADFRSTAQILSSINGIGKKEPLTLEQEIKKNQLEFIKILYEQQGLSGSETTFLETN